MDRQKWQGQQGITNWVLWVFFKICQLSYFLEESLSYLNLQKSAMNQMHKTRWYVCTFYIAWIEETSSNIFRQPWNTKMYLEPNSKLAQNSSFELLERLYSMRHLTSAEFQTPMSIYYRFLIWYITLKSKKDNGDYNWRVSV